MWTSLFGEFCFKESSNISPNFVLLRRQRNAHWHNRIKSGKTDTAAAVSCDFFVSQKKPWGGRLPNKGEAKKRNWRARRLSPGWKGQRQVIYFILKISLTQSIINSFKSLISSGSLKPILIVLWTTNIRRVKKCPDITISGQWWQSRIAIHKIAPFLYFTSRQGRFLFEPTGQSGEDCATIATITLLQKLPPYLSVIDIRNVEPMWLGAKQMSSSKATYVSMAIGQVCSFAWKSHQWHICAVEGSDFKLVYFPQEAESSLCLRAWEQFYLEVRLG